MKPNEGTTITRYKIEYKARITKVKKEAVILARTKVEAKRGLTMRETSPIIQQVYPLGEVTLPYNLILPYVEKIDFVKGD